MRTRSTVTPSTIPIGTWRQDQYNSITGAFIRTVTGSSPAFTYGATANSSDLITDEEVRFQRYGVCTHTRTRCRIYDSGFSVTWIHSPDKYVEKWGGGYFQYTVMRNLAPGWLSPSVTVRSGDWETYSYDAFEAMRPKFSDASFFNDILELGQIADLINPLGLRKGWRRRSLARDKVPVLDRIRAVANLHLWYQFGIKPALASMREVNRLLAKLPEIIRKYREEGERIQKRHYSRKMDTVDLPPDALVYNTSGIKVNRQTRWLTPPVYHASVRYKYDLSHISDFEMRLRAWAQAFGLDKPLQVAWNAIPLSFVVDWFVDIGKWLGSLTNDDLIPIVVQDFCHSTKFEHATTALIEYPFGTGPVKPVVTCPVGQRSVLVYDRRRGVPCTTSRIRFNMPNVAKVFTLGALAVQRIPRKSLSMPSKRRLPWLNFSSRLTVVR